MRTDGGSSRSTLPLHYQSPQIRTTNSSSIAYIVGVNKIDEKLAMHWLFWAHPESYRYYRTTSLIIIVVTLPLVT